MIYVVCSKCGEKVDLHETEFYGLVRKENTALLCQIERLTDTNKRLGDLVRHQRGELHCTGLITDEEYAVLAEDHAAVARLEGYDALRARLRKVTELERLFEELKRRFAEAEENRKNLGPQMEGLIKEAGRLGFDKGAEAAFKYLSGRGLVGMSLLDEWKGQLPKEKN